MFSPVWPPAELSGNVGKHVLDSLTSLARGLVHPRHQVVALFAEGLDVSVSHADARLQIELVATPEVVIGRIAFKYGGLNEKEKCGFFCSMDNISCFFCVSYYFLPLQSFSALNAPALCAQTVGPRSKVKVSLESLVNGLSCPQSGRMGSDDSFWSQIDQM